MRSRSQAQFFRPCVVIFILLLAASRTPAKTIQVEAPSTLKKILDVGDSDHDLKITVRDRYTTFWLEAADHARYEVSGPYYLSNLLQELKLAETDAKGPLVTIDSDHIFENPVTRISRLIKTLYWDNLTRRVDAKNIGGMLIDPKFDTGPERTLFVPADDKTAFDYFTKTAHDDPKLHLQIYKIGKCCDKETDALLHKHHGVLSLGLRETSKGGLEGIPFVVPGGRFNEMYGWDSYFESLGLIEDGRVDLARAMVDNLVYEIEHYGRILNGNRSYYLSRSQPPFLTSMAYAVYEHLPKNEDSKSWLAKAYRAAMTEYFDVWMNKDRLTSTGLSRYFGTGHGIPPEVEPGHFDHVLKPAAARHKMSIADLTARYNDGSLQDAKLDEFFAQDQAVRESGHDTTYRWRVNGVDRVADFVTVDLNSLLYKYELDFARVSRDVFADRFPFRSMKSALDWSRAAGRRKDLIRTYLWDPEQHLFFDYNYKSKSRSHFVSATTFYPLWAFDTNDANTKILGDKDALAFFQKATSQLELPGGLVSGTEASLNAVGDLKNPRQWDFPNGWAPHQLIAWRALHNYNQIATADRLIYEWLYMITRNAANYNGTIPEKFDVVHRSHAVFAEYGNVGTDFSYITREGFGWMNASYEVGLSLLSSKWRNELESLTPPEWLSLGSAPALVQKDK